MLRAARPALVAGCLALVACSGSGSPPAEARLELVSAIMEASGNLICRLIARALLVQFRPRMIPLEQHVVVDQQAHRDLARRLDAALAERDVAAVRETFRAMSAVNRESAQRAFAALGLNGSRGLHAAVEVNAS